MITDREKIRMVARDIGDHYPPMKYRDEVLKRFKTEVSSASVVRAIGSYANRLKANQPAILSKANILLAECFYDSHLAVAMVKKAYLSP